MAGEADRRPATAVRMPPLSGGKWSVYTPRYVLDVLTVDHRRTMCQRAEIVITASSGNQYCMASDDERIWLLGYIWLALGEGYMRGGTS